MKRLLMLVPLALLLAGTGANAASQPVGVSPYPMVGGGAAAHSNQIRKEHAIIALLRKGKAIQIADGGTLTPAHHVELQQEYRDILAGNY